MDINILEQLLIDVGVHALKITDTINYDDNVDMLSGDDIIIKDNKTLVDDYISQLTCEESTKEEVTNIFNKIYLDAIRIKNDSV